MSDPSDGADVFGTGALTARTVTIQSVLDVRDETPMAKGGTPCFGRSILILTPQRALKFTATSRERHHVWLTALSFLSHSHSVVPAELGGGPLPAPPLPNAPAPSIHNYNPRNSTRPAAPPPPPAAPAVSLRRHPIRDSIRIAKGKEHPYRPGSSRRGAPPPSRPPYPDDGAAAAAAAAADDDDDGAEPPLVPRTRRNTGPSAAHGGPPPHRPGSAFRSFSNSVVPPAPAHHPAGAAPRPSIVSLASRAESDFAATHGGGGGGGASDVGSARTSRANFFEAVGTVRMEAFVRDMQLHPHPHPHPPAPAPAPRGTAGRASLAAGPGPRASSQQHPPKAAAAAARDEAPEKGGVGGVAGPDGRRERGSYRARTGMKKDMRPAVREGGTLGDLPVWESATLLTLLGARVLDAGPG